MFAGQVKTATEISLPPMTGGINAQAPLQAMSPAEAVYLYNIVSNERGLRVRGGGAEFCNAVTGSAKTFIPFLDVDGTEQLFACADDGIYDVSTGGAGSASLVYSFVTPSSSAGYGTWIQYTNDAGARFILYADSVNGLIEYDIATTTWQLPTGITGLPGGGITDVRVVLNHKQRVWLAQEGAAEAYYLPVGAKAGAATPFYFARHFAHGGDIVNLFEWTRDGGDGVDDYFIAVGRGGDIVVYRGEDPSAATTWTQVGKWFMGRVPAGRRVAVEHGGEVYVLSVYGLFTLSSLFRGTDITEFKNHPSAKITHLIRERMVDEVDNAGWAVIPFPAEGNLVIQSPDRDGNVDNYLQYVFNLTTQTWGFWRDIPIVSAVEYRSQFHYGSGTSVWRLLDGPDNVLLDDEDASEIEPVEFSVLGSFQHYDMPARWKIPSFIRCVFQGRGPTEYNAKIVFDYQVDNLIPTGDAITGEGDVWDTGVWDTAIWGGAVSSLFKIFGSGGMGRVAAPAIRGRAYFRTRLLEIDLVFRAGNFL